MIVDVDGTPVEFGDMPLADIRSVLKKKREDFDRAKARIVAEEIAKAIPQPPEPQDYSPDFATLGGILIAVREELKKEPKDYSDAFKAVCDAVSGINIPEAKDVDLKPVVDALSVLEPADVSKVEGELRDVKKLLAALNQKESRVILPPEKDRPVVDEIVITERDNAGNAKRFKVVYQ